MINFNLIFFKKHVRVEKSNERDNVGIKKDEINIIMAWTHVITAKSSVLLTRKLTNNPICGGPEIRVMKNMIGVGINRQAFMVRLLTILKMSILINFHENHF